MTERHTGAGPPALRLEDVALSYGAVSVLDGVDLTVPAGSVAAVLGVSGCGKTTLLRLVAGFEVPGRGQVQIGGRAVAGAGTNVAPEHRSVGIVPQEGALFPHLSVRRNVGYGLPRSGAGTDRVEELLDVVGLPDIAERMPHELSGGQQQRVAVARALARRPDLVLLDEPFNALDAGLRAGVRAQVLHAIRASSATALLVTHDQEEALSSADMVAVLRAGRIAQAADPRTLYRRPVDLGVAEFVGAAIRLDACVEGTAARTELGRLDLAGPVPDGAAIVVLRPGQLTVEAAEDRAAAGTVRSVRFLGPHAMVDVRLRSGADVTARCDEDPPAPGTRVAVRVRGTVVAFPAPKSGGTAQPADSARCTASLRW